MQFKKASLKNKLVLIVCGSKSLDRFHIKLYFFIDLADDGDEFKFLKK